MKRSHVRQNNIPVKIIQFKTTVQKKKTENY